MKLLDTNILLDHSESIFKNSQEKFIIHSIVLEELDNIIHNSLSDEKKYKARQARNKIKEVYDHGLIDYSLHSPIFSLPLGWDYDKNDNNLLRVCKDLGYCLVTNDLLMQVKADCIKVSWEEFNAKNNEDEIYTGYKEVVLSDYEQALFYQEGKFNKWDLLNNQYLIIKNEDGEIIDKYRWTDEKGFVTLKTTSFKSIYFQDFKPKDVYQMLAMDSLYNTDFTLFFGRAGSAKTTLALSYVMQQIQTNKINKCVIIFNSVPLKNNKELGFYPGNRNEKLLSSSLGGILISKFGDITAIEALINQGKLLLIPSAEIRGIEVGEHDCLFVTEAQNTDAYTMRTILQRVKDGCKTIIEGDLLEQQDIKNYGLKENGMYRALETFKGDKSFSCVKLKNVYRGHIADVAQNI